MRPSRKSRVCCGVKNNAGFESLLAGSADAPTIAAGIRVADEPRRCQTGHGGRTDGAGGRGGGGETAARGLASHGGRRGDRGTSRKRSAGAARKFSRWLAEARNCGGRGAG